MWSVLQSEFNQLPRRLGGLRGGLLLAALVALGALPPFRFGSSFLDPLILLAYTSFSVLFASSFAVRSFTESENASGISDSDWVNGKILAAALYGFLAFVVILGGALLALNSGRSNFLLPSVSTVVALVLVAAALSTLAASASAVAAFTAQSPAAAQQLVRLGFFFVLLLLLGVTRFAPPAWSNALAGLLDREYLLRNAFLLAVPLLFFAGLFVRRAAAILEERRTGLSIL